MKVEKRNVVEKKKMSLWVPSTLYERIDSESKKYGISKTTIVQNMMVSYYRCLDNSINK